MIFDSLKNHFINGWVKAKKFITTGGTSDHFVKGDGSLDATVYALDSDVPKNLQESTDNGNTTDNDIILYSPNTSYVSWRTLDGSGYNSGDEILKLCKWSNIQGTDSTYIVGTLFVSHHSSTYGPKKQLHISARSGWNQFYSYASMILHGDDSLTHQKLVTYDEDGTNFLGIRFYGKTGNQGVKDFKFVGDTDLTSLEFTLTEDVSNVVDYESRSPVEYNISEMIIRYGNINLKNGIVSVVGGNSNYWNEAYNWGNHADEGYATETYVEDVIEETNDSNLKFIKIDSSLLETQDSEGLINYLNTVAGFTKESIDQVMFEVSTGISVTPEVIKKYSLVNKRKNTYGLGGVLLNINDITLIEKNTIDLISSDDSIYIEGKDITVNTNGWELDNDLNNLTPNIQI